MPGSTWAGRPRLGSTSTTSWVAAGTPGSRTSERTSPGPSPVPPEPLDLWGGDAECIAGATFSYGERPDAKFGVPKLETEFGTFPHFYFLELKFYF